MSETAKLDVTVRTQRGTRNANRLRREGRIPGVLYGHGQAVVAVAASAEALETVLRGGAKVLSVQFDGTSETALVRELQWDTFGRKLLHFDLTRISMDERIVIEVPVELRGIPKGTREGGVLEHHLHRIQVECLPTNIPTEIRVNVAAMAVGEALHVREVPFPAGVRALADPEALVARVALPVDEAAAALAEPSAAEPEIIGRREKPEETGEAE